MTAASTVLALLASGVPLSLLTDLATPDGPDSVEIARREGVSGLLVVPGAAPATPPRVPDAVGHPPARVAVG